MKISYWLIPFFILAAIEQMGNREGRPIVLYGLTLMVVSFFSVDGLWWLLTPFWYGAVIYPFRELWRN